MSFIEKEGRQAARSALARGGRSRTLTFEEINEPVAGSAPPSEAKDDDSDETDFGEEDIEVSSPLGAVLPEQRDRNLAARMSRKRGSLPSRRAQATPAEAKRAGQRISQLAAIPGVVLPKAVLQDSVWIGYFVDLLERLRAKQKQGSDAHELTKVLHGLMNDEEVDASVGVRLLELAMNDVGREQLLSAVHEDLSRFWKGIGDPRWCTNLRDAWPARARQILKWKRETLCLKVEVDNWLLRHRLRWRPSKHCKETQDERRDRLEDFWTEYRTVSKKQDQLPSISSPPSSPSKQRFPHAQSARTGELFANQNLWLAPEDDDSDSDLRPASPVLEEVPCRITTCSCERCLRSCGCEQCLRSLAGSTAHSRICQRKCSRKGAYSTAYTSFRSLAGSTSLPNLNGKSRLNDWVATDLRGNSGSGSRSGSKLGTSACAGAPRPATRTSPLPAIGPPSSPTKRYLQVCYNNSVVPTPIPFVTGHSLKLSAEGKALTDKDLIAVAMMVRGMKKVEEVDLSGNTLLTERSLLPFVNTLFGKPASPSLRRLNLSHCVQAGTSALRAGHSTLHTVASLLAAPDGALKLRQLDVSHIPISMPCQLALCDAVRGHAALQSLNLADVGLGRASSQSARQCVGAILGSRSLRALDLGWNCFTSEVFAHLGERVATKSLLTSLSVANSSASTLPGFCASSAARFQAIDCPVMFFIEQLARDSSLTQLDVSMNRIDFRGALVVEDSFEWHKQLLELNISQNPLGTLGMRSMLRLLSRDYSSLGHFVSDGCADGLLPEGDDSTQIFSATNPGGRYRLDFCRPYHRSILRMLYKTCLRFKLQPCDAFSTIACSPDLKGFSHAPLSHDGKWEVPTAGILTTNFTVENAMEAAMVGVDSYDFGTFLERHYSMVRMKSGFKKEVPLFAQWKLLDGRSYEQRVLLDAFSKDFSITLPEVEMMCATRSQVGEVICRLMHCVEGGETARYLAMMHTPTLGDYFRIRKHIRSLMEFNVDNPTGRYRFDLGNACDYSVAERLLLVDRWEQGVSRAKSYADTSQTGNASNARNERHQDLPLLTSFGIKSIAEWNPPEHGVFELDYLSGKRPPAGAKILDKETFDRVLCTVQQSSTSPQDEIDILRTVSNWMYVSALQVRELLGLYSSENERCELFVLFFQRIVDIHNEKLCRVRFNNADELRNLRNRLGHTTYFPFIQPEHTLFDFDFSIHDERLACNLLLQIAAKEQLTNIKKDSIAYMRLLPSGGLEEDPLPQGVPRSWESFGGMPQGGTFKCVYNCAPEDRNVVFRSSLLETYGYWPSDTKDTEWWAALTDAPPDLIELLEFLLGRFANLSKAFRAIDGPGGNGVISRLEFEEGYKALNCHKFDGPNEKERLNAVFRYLDPGGEGSVSLQEWGVLSMFWNELQLSMQEFVQFLQRTFGDEDSFEKELFTAEQWKIKMREILKSAWEYIDEDQSNSIDLEEWTTVVHNKLRYFGPSEVLFHYLDKDDEGTVSFDEFMFLEEYLSNPFVIGQKAA